MSGSNSNSLVNCQIPLQEYFRDKIKEKSKKLGINLDTSIEFYLVTLLDSFLKPKNFNYLSSTPLVFQLKSAIDNPTNQSIHTLKSLGDISLYISGIFPEYFDNKIYSINYYIQMGKNAYLHIAESISRIYQEEHFKGLYTNLAKNFKHLVELLNEIMDKNEFNFSDIKGNYEEILKKYSRWADIGSPSIERSLIKSGLILNKSDSLN